MKKGMIQPKSNKKHSIWMIAGYLLVRGKSMLAQTVMSVVIALAE